MVYIAEPLIQPEGVGSTFAAGVVSVNEGKMMLDDVRDRFA